MESHMLNIYHQAPYCGIGHTTPQSTSESVSSESSCNQSSPEYAMNQKSSQYDEVNEEGEFWDHNNDNDNNAWTNSQNVNMTQTNHDTSTEQINVNTSDYENDVNVSMELSTSIVVQMRDSSLVAGDDYEVVQIYEVNPYLEFQATSDEEEDENEETISANEEGYETQYEEDSVSEHEASVHTHNIPQSNKEVSKATHNVSQDSLGINLDSPVVSNVDEYFAKPNNDKLLEVEQKRVVNDLDEYFLSQIKKPKGPNILEYFNDQVPKTVPLEIFAPDNSDTIKDVENHEVFETVDNVGDVPLNESDLDVLPNIEELKRFILGEIPFNKVKNANKTHSVSLPHSPMHSFGLDLDAKGSLTFEDLNLDLSDISFENDREKMNSSMKNDDAPRTLTEEDINSFLITDKKESNPVFRNEDDLNLQDMEMDRPVDALIDIEPASAFRLTDRKFTSTPLPGRILEFCIEKPKVIRKEPEIKIDVEDFVDVETCPETVVPVLEASNVDSLLEQFEATENLNNTQIKPIVSEKITQAKSNLTSGMRLQDAGVQLTKTKMKKILMPSKVNSVMRSSASHTDHDYCSPKKRHSLPNLKGGRSLLKPEVLSSNNRILNSRHRSCKNKKVVYHDSSDEEGDTNDKKKIKVNGKHINDQVKIKNNKKSCLKTSDKPTVSRKKLSHARSAVNSSGLTKNNDSVIVNNACEAISDNSSSQKSNNGSIKLVIKNKSKVIIQNCDVSGLNKDISSEKSKSSKAYSNSNKVSTDVSNVVTSVEPLDRRRNSDKGSTNTDLSIEPLHRSSSLSEPTNITNTVKNVQPLDTGFISNNVLTHVNKTVKNVDPSRETSTKISTHVKNIVRSGDRTETSNKVSKNAKNDTKIIQSSDRSSDMKKISKHGRNDESEDRTSIPNKASKQVKNSIKTVESDGRNSTSKKESSNVNTIAKSVESESLDKIKGKNDSHSKKEKMKEKQNKSATSQQNHFYTTLFNKEDVEVPKSVHIPPKVKRKDECNRVALVDIPIITEVEQPIKKKKLNLKEYKLRIGKGSNNTSPQVSPESIFPETPCNLDIVKNFKIAKEVTNVSPPKENVKADVPKVVFDPILEASRKVLMNIQKQKDKASKRQESIMIQKVDNLVLQPLISDAEMMKIVGMTPNVVPVPTEVPMPRELPKDYDEIILVSVGTNTDDGLLKPAEKQVVASRKRKLESPQEENKSTINFKIRKTDSILKQNVFESVKILKSPIEDKNRSDIKIDKERYKDITETLKSVEKHVDTKMSSNSLFASIQDVVMKKAPTTAHSSNDRKSKSNSPVEKQEFKYTKPVIVREYDNTAPHGEDKVILHLEKTRHKPERVTTCIQTDATVEFVELPKVNQTIDKKQLNVLPRKRNDSDMSMSSDCSPVRPKKDQNVTSKPDDRVVNVKRTETRQPELSQYQDNGSRSRSIRYDHKYRRSISKSRNHRRKRSPSRNRSRSRGHYGRYRRSDSPYRRKRRSRTRSPYRSSRRSPSVKRHYRSNHSRSRSNNSRSISKIGDQIKSCSPIPKKRQSPQYTVNKSEKITAESLTPPIIRKQSISERSDTSSSTTSSSSSSSSGSTASSKSRASCGSFRNVDGYKAKSYRSSYSSEDRESNTPVEERRIVFVGRLEKDITKLALRAQFIKFGSIAEVRLHSKEDGSRYGFVTFQRPRDAWSAVEAASTFPQYDVGFGGRRAFCRQSYADLDGLEAKYSENAFHGQAALPARRDDDMSFEQMLLDMKKTLNKRKGDKKSDDISA